jgi:hypothetical protein
MPEILQNFQNQINKIFLMFLGRSIFQPVFTAGNTNNGRQCHIGRSLYSEDRNLTGQRTPGHDKGLRVLEDDETGAACARSCTRGSATAATTAGICCTTGPCAISTAIAAATQTSSATSPPGSSATSATAGYPMDTPDIYSNIGFNKKRAISG